MYLTFPDPHDALRTCLKSHYLDDTSVYFPRGYSNRRVSVCSFLYLASVPPTSARALSKYLRTFRSLAAKISSWVHERSQRHYRQSASSNISSLHGVRPRGGSHRFSHAAPAARPSSCALFIRLPPIPIHQSSHFPTFQRLAFTRIIEPFPPAGPSLSVHSRVCTGIGEASVTGDAQGKSWRSRKRQPSPLASLFPLVWGYEWIRTTYY